MSEGGALFVTWPNNELPKPGRIERTKGVTGLGVVALSLDGAPPCLIGSEDVAGVVIGTGSWCSAATGSTEEIVVGLAVVPGAGAPVVYYEGGTGFATATGAGAPVVYDEGGTGFAAATGAGAPVVCDEGGTGFAGKAGFSVVTGAGAPVACEEALDPGTSKVRVEGARIADG